MLARNIGKREELFEQFTDQAISLLIQEKYLSSEKDWNRKTNKIKLTGVYGENRRLTCTLIPYRSLLLVDEKGCVIEYRLKNNEDILLSAKQLVSDIKESKSFEENSRAFEELPF